MQQDSDTEPHDPPRRESVLADLISQLFRDAEILLLQEFALARAEIGEALGGVAGGALLLLSGVATCFAGGLALIAALVMVLEHVVPPWVACALVGVTVFAAGAALALFGWRLVARASLVPRRAMQSVRDTGAWVREELT